MFKDVDAIGRRQNVHLAKFLTEERVQQRRLSGLHLPYDHKEKRFTHIFQHVLQGVENRGLALHIGRRS